MAKRITKAQREQAKANEFRRVASALLHLRHNDWNDWEYEWLRAAASRNPSYRFSDKEQAKLDQLRGLSKPFTSYAGSTVPELIKIAFPLRFDLDENDQEFLEKLHGWGATELRLRQVRRLARICRSFGEFDVELDEAA